MTSLPHASEPFSDFTNRSFQTSDDDDYKTNSTVYRGDKTQQWFFVECSHRCEQCGDRPGHCDAIVVEVGGACRANGLPHAQAAAAVYFNMMNTDYNCSFLVPGLRQTNQRAELHAGLSGLRLTSRIRAENLPLTNAEVLAQGDFDPLTKVSRAVIKSDSEYMVKGMTDWIYKWKTNGFLTAQGTPVVNADLFRDIEAEVEVLNSHNVQVQFWHVPKKQIEMADYLAGCRLEGLKAEDAVYRCLEMSGGDKADDGDEDEKDEAEEGKGRAERE